MSLGEYHHCSKLGREQFGFDSSKWASLPVRITSGGHYQGPIRTQVTLIALRNVANKNYSFGNFLIRSRFAKMSHKGISFSSDAGGLVYLVDAAGCRSTTDVFSDMSGDFSVPVFRGEYAFGPELMDQCMALLHSGQYWVTEDGVENWIINGIRVSQAPDGMVR